MKIIDYVCTACGQDWTRIAFDKSACSKSICCKCCKKQGLQPLGCKMAQLELKRFAMGKQLNGNDVKGLLLERAVSTALYALGILHRHNPFDNTYPCYQNKRPDITIPRIDTVIECKNLNKKQVDHRLCEEWLDKNIIKRKYRLTYRRKIVIFSHSPRRRLRNYLETYGWKVYSLGMQITIPEESRRAIGKLKQRLYWLSKEYNKTQKPIPKQQTRLRLAYPQKVAPHNVSHS